MAIFEKGEIVMYNTKRGNDNHLKPNDIAVRIVGVHYDDMPNIYYTIRPVNSSQATFDEKQTDRNRLVGTQSFYKIISLN